MAKLKTFRRICAICPTCVQYQWQSAAHFRTGDPWDGRDRGALAVGGQCASHSPNRLRYDRHGNQLKAMQETGTDRTLQCVRAVSKEDERDSRWECEGGPCREAAEITASHQSNRKTDLTAGRPRQKLAQCNEIGVGVFVEPTTPDDEFVSEIANVGNRSTKAGYSQFAESEQHFQRRTRSITFCAPCSQCHRPEFLRRVINLLQGKHAIERSTRFYYTGGCPSIHGTKRTLQISPTRQR